MHTYIMYDIIILCGMYLHKWSFVSCELDLSLLYSVVFLYSFLADSLCIYVCCVCMCV